MAWDDTQTATDTITYTEWNNMVTYVKNPDEATSYSIDIASTPIITVEATGITVDGTITVGAYTLTIDETASLSDYLHTSGGTVTGDLTMSGGDIVLGTQSIGYDNTGGLSFDASNNATFSGELNIENATGDAFVEIDTSSTDADSGFRMWYQNDTKYIYYYDSSRSTFKLYNYTVPTTVFTVADATGNIKYVTDCAFGNDDNFKIFNDSGTHKLQFDANDYFGYVTASDYYEWGIGGTVEMTLSASALDLNDNVLQNAVISTTASATEGAIKWDSTNHKLLIYNGSAWETVTSST
jgi:hypothetical protein